jgi:DNA polymerase elongation subunit (family B)
MFGYRNAVYDYKNKVVDLYTWAKDGTRIMTSIECRPYFYYEDNYGNETSIFDSSVSKRSFETVFDKNKFIKERGLRRLFDNFNPVQQVLIDTFWNYNDSEDFTKFPLKIHFVDIEAVGQNGFSSPDDPNDEINVITIYDSLKKKFYVWGTEPYTPEQSDVKYFYCGAEHVLLDKFVDFLKKDSPDILSGWNSGGYDIPYIVNRVERVLGKDRADELSPYRRRYTKQVMGKFGKMNTIHHLEGISSVDYMDIYKKFCPKNRESYKLDYIGQVELDETKVDYGDMSLYEFMTSDWKTFVDYNIQDVRLLVKLEERLQYIELLRMLAYIGCSTFESALGTVAVVTGAAGVEAKKRNQKLFTNVVDDQEVRNFEGGFVADPIAGHHSGIVTFDANSLYPNTMITLNTSPETKVGKILEIEKDKITIRNVDGIIVDMKPREFNDFIRKERISISRSKVLFSQKKRGILPDLMDQFYKKRVQIRSTLKQLKIDVKSADKESKKKIKIRINQLDVKQQAIKTYLNATYGACANKYCPIGDMDIAESITLTGQAVIKQAREIYKNYIRENTDIKDEATLESGLIFGDTDSLGVLITPLVKEFSKNGKITEESYEAAEKLQNYINQGINKWAVKTLNTNDCRFEFKRELMCDSAIFLEKKRYVFHVLDKEGIPCDDWKYTGIELVRTTMPKAIKPYVEKIIQSMVMTKSEKLVNDIFREAYEEFIKMDISEISLLSGIKNMEKYEAKSEGFKTAKGMPCHVKAAYYYNLLLDELGLEKKYEKITSGDKIKYFYTEKPNVYSIDAIAFKGKYPTEFNDLLKPDMYVMFEKDMYKCVERFYNVMNWVPRKPTEQLVITLDELFC